MKFDIVYQRKNCIPPRNWESRYDIQYGIKETQLTKKEKYNVMMSFNILGKKGNSWKKYLIFPLIVSFRPKNSVRSQNFPLFAVLNREVGGDIQIHSE